MKAGEERYFESLRRWVYDRTGLYYPERKHLLLYNRLQKLCLRHGIPGLKELDRHLRKRDLPGLEKEVAHAVSTGHSYFFREERVFHFFREHILPTLPTTGRHRLWSAASASGEEAYTMAIVLTESLGFVRARERTAILGTDIDRVMVQQAERGVYPEQRLENVPVHLRPRYFRRVGPGQWGVVSGLKEMCTFRRLNLMSSPWPFKSRFHVVLCRNVLYYFDVEHQRDLAERLYDATAPGGWMLTSVTEPVQSLKTRWSTVTTGVYRKA